RGSCQISSFLWKNQQKFERELENLKLVEETLDSLIKSCAQQLFDMTDDMDNAALAYVTHEDISRVRAFEEQTVIVVKAPEETKLEVPAPKEDSIQVHLKGGRGPIMVVTCDIEAGDATTEKSSCFLTLEESRIKTATLHTEHFSVERALELIWLPDGDESDLDNLSDNDDAILDAGYQPPPQVQSSSEDDSSGEEDPIPTEHSRGRKRLRCQNNDSGTGTGTGSDYEARSHTPRRPRQTQRIEADDSNNGPEEPTPGPSPQGQSNKGRGIRWRATPLTPNLAEFEHEDDTEQDRHG
ncbi:transcription factor E2FA-like, partial [Plectropomus leopardus]|uniref:transcription factor E2FA-like n=1 Tax=Plectropomus leopardus TaxID=160734 RepID=UPI001C4CBD16